MARTAQKQKGGIQIPINWERIFVDDKLQTRLTIGVMLAVALVFGVLVASKTVVGLSLFGFIVSLFAISACIVSLETGLYISIIYSFFAFGFTRYLFGDAFPVGIGTDVLIFSTFLALVIHHKTLAEDFNRFIKTPLVIWIVIVVAYLFLQIANPYADSVEGWLQTFRRFLESLLLLFICYCVFRKPAAMNRFLKALFIMAVVSAVYGCIQQWHGLFDFEIAWVMATENRFGLIFINGNYRKFSTMSDPTAYGIAMAACVILFSILAWHQKKWKIKLILAIGILFMMLGMAYSGTRTANAMVVIGLALYVLLSVNRPATRAFAVVGLLAFLFLMYAPIYSNPTLNRFRSSFEASDDESFKVREVNRKYIQPFIYSHPIGWGLGTSGAQGLQYNPGHFLAGFPPDSGYLKKALETGWIGFILTLLFYFVVLRTGIGGYFSSKFENRKVLFVAATAVLFSFYIAEFAQEAIGQITDMVIYYPLIAMILRMRHWEEGTEEEKDADLNPVAYEG